MCTQGGTIGTVNGDTAVKERRVELLQGGIPESGAGRAVKSIIKPVGVFGRTCPGGNGMLPFTHCKGTSEVLPNLPGAEYNSRRGTVPITWAIPRPEGNGWELDFSNVSKVVAELIEILRPVTGLVNMCFCMVTVKCTRDLKIMLNPGFETLNEGVPHMRVGEPRGGGRTVFVNICLNPRLII
jgi:hypothetical protein